MEQREKLLARREAIQARKEKTQEALRDSQAEMTDELSQYDQHPADSGSELFEREKDYAFLESMERELQKIDQALERLQQGRYGICENCGNQIESVRQERLLHTTLCAECARQNEAQIPASSQVLYERSAEAMEFAKTFTPAGYEFYEE